MEIIGILAQSTNASDATDITQTKEEIELALVNYYDTTGKYTEDDVLSAVQDVLGSTATIDEETEGVYTVTTSKNNVVDITNIMNSASDGSTGNTGSVTTISTTESYVGYYADLDPTDGTIDGIIYADLMKSASYSYWSPGSASLTSIGYGAYSWTVLTEADGVKSYYVSQESYTDDFGTKAVISPVSGTTGKERFYVMALDDVDSSYHYWYYSAYGNMTNYATDTSGDFGTGKANTKSMITIWNSGDYGTQNGDSSYTDMWGLDAVQTGYTNGWFVPSRAEWSTFGAELGVTKSNYGNYGLSRSCWSSSQWSSTGSYNAVFIFGYLAQVYANGGCYVRLSTTF